MSLFKALFCPWNDVCDINSFGCFFFLQSTFQISLKVSWRGWMSLGMLDRTVGQELVSLEFIWHWVHRCLIDRNLSRELMCLTTACYLCMETSQVSFVIRKRNFSPAPVQTIYWLCVRKYNSTDLRALVKDVKNHTLCCKRKFLWIIFYLSTLGKFTYRLNPKYTKCQPVYILMPSHQTVYGLGSTLEHSPHYLELTRYISEG